MFYVYILQSISSGRYYTGSTGNLEDRMNRHQQDRSKSTRGKGPWQLVYSKAFLTRSEAVKQEYKIKGTGAERYLKDQKRTG